MSDKQETVKEKPAKPAEVAKEEKKEFPEGGVITTRTVDLFKKG